MEEGRAELIWGGRVGPVIFVRVGRGRFGISLYCSAYRNPSGSSFGYHEYSAYCIAKPDETSTSPVHFSPKYRKSEINPSFLPSWSVC